jgi:hypothetical protein
MSQNQADRHASSIQGAGKPPRSLASRLLIYTTVGAIIVLILLVLGMYIWKNSEVRNLEQKIDIRQAEMTEERHHALDVQAQNMLRLAAIPLAWAVRTEVMRGDLSRVDDYFRDFVREPGVQSVLLIDKDNKIALASNRKLETLPANKVVSQAILDAQDTVIERPDSILRLGVPIMSFNEKLGILVVDYRLQDRQISKPKP